VPVVNVGAVSTLRDDPTFVTLAELGHGNGIERGDNGVVLKGREGWF